MRVRGIGDDLRRIAGTARADFDGDAPARDSRDRIDYLAHGETPAVAWVEGAAALAPYPEAVEQKTG